MTLGMAGRGNNFNIIFRASLKDKKYLLPARKPFNDHWLLLSSEA
jgi:hypothetical protein